MTTLTNLISTKITDVDQYEYSSDKYHQVISYSTENTIDKPCINTIELANYTITTKDHFIPTLQLSNNIISGTFGFLQSKISPTVGNPVFVTDNDLRKTPKYNICIRAEPLFVFFMNKLYPTILPTELTEHIEKTLKTKLIYKLVGSDDHVRWGNIVASFEYQNRTLYIATNKDNHGYIMTVDNFHQSTREMEKIATKPVTVYNRTTKQRIYISSFKLNTLNQICAHDVDNNELVLPNNIIILEHTTEHTINQLQNIHPQDVQAVIQLLT